MAAGDLDITVEQGADWGYTLTWKDSGGTPVDLTGYTARMQIRPDYADNDVTNGTENTPLLDLTTENGGITLGGIAGTIALAATATQTAALEWDGSARWDLELVHGSHVTRLLEGKAKLSREVTR